MLSCRANALSTVVANNWDVENTKAVGTHLHMHEKSSHVLPATTVFSIALDIHLDLNTRNTFQPQYAMQCVHAMSFVE